MAIPSYRGGNINGMQPNESSSDLVAMLQGPCSNSPHVGQLQVVAPGLLASGLEAAVTTPLTGQKRPYSPAYSYDGPTVEDGPSELDGEDVGDELQLLPGGSPLEKKRRLTFDQVRSLERNFEMENKLEPERKMQLAKELGLRPRQVAVWFQNRRARWKTKQLERDYETLAADYERLKADYELVLGEKKQLKAEVQRLSSNADANASEVKPEPPTGTPPTSSQEFVSHNNHARTSPSVDVSNLSEDDSTTVSGSSDVLDADSPRTTDSSSSDVLREDPQHQIDGHSPNSFSSFLGEDSGLLQVPLEGIPGASPNPNDGDGDGGFHEFVDQSCNYLLLQLDEQSGLPWWDWP